MAIIMCDGIFKNTGDKSMEPKKPPTDDLLLYYSFIKDAENLGLSPPSFSQFMVRPGYYEGWLSMALDEPPKWFKEAFEK